MLVVCQLPQDYLFFARKPPIAENKLYQPDNIPANVPPVIMSPALSFEAKNVEVPTSNANSYNIQYFVKIPPEDTKEVQESTNLNVPTIQGKENAILVEAGKEIEPTVVTENALNSASGNESSEAPLTYASNIYSTKINQPLNIPNVSNFTQKQFEISNDSLNTAQKSDQKQSTLIIPKVPQTRVDTVDITTETLLTNKKIEQMEAPCGTFPLKNYHDLTNDPNVLRGNYMTVMDQTHLPINITNLPDKLTDTKNESNDYGVYKYHDLSSEVKHAHTPINVAQTHSPQLPMPSPNYPVQTQLSMDSSQTPTFPTNLESFSAAVSSNSTSYVHNTLPPNTYVPTLNNNYISAPQITSQSDVKENTFVKRDLPNPAINTESYVEPITSIVNNKSYKLTTNLSETNNLNNKGLSDASFDNTPYLSKVNPTLNAKVQQQPKCDLKETLNHPALPEYAQKHSENQNDFSNSFSTFNSTHAEQKMMNCLDYVKIQNIVNACQKRGLNSDIKFTVLNVPTLSYQSPPSKKQGLSRIDVAIMKRKQRLQKRVSKHQVRTKENKSGLENSTENLSDSNVTTEHGIPIYGYPDSPESNICSEDESDSDSSNSVDLWIKAGPPCKPVLTSEKLKFMRGVDLVTLNKRDDVNFEKLKRRKWQSPWKCLEESKSKINDTLDLPVPSQSPSVLNTTSDRHHKNDFLQLLELRTVSPIIREDFEVAWMKIIHERLKRDCGSALTTYSIRAQRKRKEREVLEFFASNHNNNHINSFNKNHNNQVVPNNQSIQNNKLALQTSSFRQNRNLKDSVNTEPTIKTPTPSKLIKYFPRIKQEDCITSFNSINNKNCVPLTMVIVEQKPWAVKEEGVEEKREEVKDQFNWPGIQEVTESYQKFAKDRDNEITTERLKCAELKEKVKFKQAESKFLERRHRELHSTFFGYEQEQKKIQKTIDHLTKITNAFR